MTENKSTTGQEVELTIQKYQVIPCFFLKSNNTFAPPSLSLCTGMSVLTCNGKTTASFDRKMLDKFGVHNIFVLIWTPINISRYISDTNLFKQESTRNARLV